MHGNYLTPSPLFFSLVLQALENASDDIASGLDSFYLIFAGALVFFMQTGFAMVSLWQVTQDKNNVVMSANSSIAFEISVVCRLN